MPIATARATAVIIGRNVYVCGGVCPSFYLACLVQVYDLDKKTWTQLPLPSPQYNSEAAAVKNELVLIGGRDAASRTATNMVSSWSGESWKQDLPSMSTKRKRPSVVTYSDYIVVAGGMGEDDRTILSSIEVLDTTSRQWQTLANLQLPQPLYQMKIAVCAAHIYVASASSGYDVTAGAGIPSRHVWRLPLATVEEVLSGEDHGPPQQWMEVEPSPKYHSALLQYTSHPLAAGGHAEDSGKATSRISIYDPHSDKWSTVGQLLEPRTRCAVVSLSGCSFMVCGGCSNAWNTQYSLMCSVEVVSIP